VFADFGESDRHINLSAASMEEQQRLKRKEDLYAEKVDADPEYGCECFQKDQA
jgi:hypothetical protein